jgi:hypothetical protein
VEAIARVPTEPLTSKPRVPVVIEKATLGVH